MLPQVNPVYFASGACLLSACKLNVFAGKLHVSKIDLGPFACAAPHVKCLVLVGNFCKR